MGNKTEQENNLIGEITSSRKFDKSEIVDVEAGNPTAEYDFGSPHRFTEGTKSLYTAKGPLKTDASITQALTEPPNLETRTSAIICKSESLSITGFPVP